MPQVLSNVAADPAAMPVSGQVKSGKGHVLLVDDDESYRETLELELTARGFSVRSFPDAKSLLAETALVTAADVLLLDWMLPRMSGFDLLTHLRRHGIGVPVAFLTGRALTSNEHLAFDHGAADFIDKARGVEVLVRRLRRLIDRSATDSTVHADTLQRCGELTLLPNIARVEWRGVDVGLTFGEYKVVELLASNVGRHVTYRAIYDQMHYEGFIAGSGDPGYRANVRSTIKRIRRKFHLVDPGFDRIGNYATIGYCWGPPSQDA
jgi:two-component system response regulator ChvI